MKIIEINCFILLLILCPKPGSGQIVYNDTKPYISQENLYKTTHQAIKIIDSLRSTGVNCARSDIFEMYNEIYLLPDGFFDVFRWQNGRWENLYANNLRGYNHGAKKFIYNNNIYSFGGYGFWKQHGQIIEFSEERGEWEILPFSFDTKPGIASWSPPNLFVISEDSISILNLESKTIKIISENILNDKLSDYLNLYTFEFDSLTFILGRRPGFSIHKKDNQIGISELSPFPLFTKTLQSGIIHIKGNQVNCYDKHLNPMNSYDVESERKFFTEVTNPYEKLKSSSNRANVIYILILCAVLIAILAFYKFKHSLQPEVKSKKLSAHPLISSLVSHKGKTLTQEQIDQIFEIDHIISPESKRFKRSQLIKELNKESQLIQNKEVISRKRDPEDGRRFIYKINFD